MSLADTSNDAYVDCCPYALRSQNWPNSIRFYILRVYTLLIINSSMRDSNFMLIEEVAWTCGFPKPCLGSSVGPSQRVQACTFVSHPRERQKRLWDIGSVKTSHKSVLLLVLRLTTFSSFVRVLLASRFIPLFKSYMQSCGQLSAADVVDSLELSHGWMSKKGKSSPIQTLKTKRLPSSMIAARNNSHLKHLDVFFASLYMNQYGKFIKETPNHFNRKTNTVIHFTMTQTFS